MAKAKRRSAAVAVALTVLCTAGVWYAVLLMNRRFIEERQYGYPLFYLFTSLGAAMLIRLGRLATGDVKHPWREAAWAAILMPPLIVVSGSMIMLGPLVFVIAALLLGKEGALDRVFLYLLAFGLCLMLHIFFNDHFGALWHDPRERAEGAARDSLSQIGRALFHYQLQNNDHMPFDERGPLHSLVLLYPNYLDDDRAFVVRYYYASKWLHDIGKPFPDDTPLAGSTCHFGYAWGLSDETARSDSAVAGELPEVIDYLGRVLVLHYDGHVSRDTIPYSSHDPADNIFAPEPGWSPDTDTWIRQK